MAQRPFWFSFVESIIVLHCSFSELRFIGQVPKFLFVVVLKSCAPPHFYSGKVNLITMRAYMVVLCLLFIALGHPSLAQSEGTSAAVAGATTAAPVGAPVDAAADADADSDLIPYTFEVNRHFTLNCTPAADVDTSGAVFLWQKNGTEVEKVPELKDRYKLEERNMVFHLSARAHEDDFGNYTCLINNLEARAWRVRASPIARLPPNSNVVEGQKLKITCKLIGKPYPPVDWTYALDETTNLTVPVEEALGARLLLADSAAGVPRGELSLEAAQRGDAGVFTCVPRGAPPAAAARTVLRVKDMYAALWPFLGICAEVFVLCAIILVYEKRRTKPELDDSDTDNHDQ